MERVDPAILLTRPRPQAERFAARLFRVLDGPRIVISPVLTIEAVADPLNLDGISGVVLTSENGARVFGDKAAAKGLRVWCVGDRTADVARDVGLDAVSAGGDADALVAMIVQANPKGPLLHAHGLETRGNVVDRLRAKGLSARGQVIYHQSETRLSAEAAALLGGTSAVVLPLFSPKSAELAGKAVKSARAPLEIAALSGAVAQAWTGPDGANFTVASRPDAAHMETAIATIWTKLLA